MTRSGRPPQSDVPASSVRALHACYREAARDEPGPILDQAILDAARAELLATARKSRRPTRWWQGWLPAATAIAAVLLGVSITWRVMDEQERSLREEMGAASTAAESAGAAASAERPAAARAANDTREPAAQKSTGPESAADRDASIGVSAVPMAKPAPASPSPTVPVAGGTTRKSPGDGTDEVRERRDRGAAMEAAPSPAPEAEKREGSRAGNGSTGETAADSRARPAAAPSAKVLGGAAAVPASDAATPAAWLQQIRELRAAGRNAEAAQSLARFRARYPDFALPEDLLNLN